MACKRSRVRLSYSPQCLRVFRTLLSGTLKRFQLLTVLLQIPLAFPGRDDRSGWGKSHEVTATGRSEINRGCRGLGWVQSFEERRLRVTKSPFCVTLIFSAGRRCSEEDSFRNCHAVQVPRIPDPDSRQEVRKPAGPRSRQGLRNSRLNTDSVP